jgi:16S rRNA (guanine527-N7)-methyltransferase
VKHPLRLEELIQFLHTQKICVSNAQFDQLEIYQTLLLNWSHRQNLFAAGDRGGLIERHFVPSFYFLYLTKKYSGNRIIDIGSGAGFPGIIIQIMNPEISVTLIDSSRKKCLFLQEVNESLSLHTRIEQIRIENMRVDDYSLYDLALARFLGDLKKLWHWVAPVLKPSGIFLMQKGGVHEESRSTKNFRIKIWQPGSQWLKIAPTLSSKYILEVKKKYE